MDFEKHHTLTMGGSLSLSDTEDGTSVAPQTAVPPPKISHFRILRPIARGGMGEVYLAEQENPKRRVALKVVGNRMSQESLSRFHSECQALALMNHNNIARIYEAGTSDDGFAYFSMEFVDGVTLDAYLLTKKLGLEDRLALFHQICEGIAHAHGKAILHRDLKPQNVLVTEVNDKPVVKIIDFGLARPTEKSELIARHKTKMGTLLGTPAYMSPEQIATSEHGLDVRTDVFSLGVIFYELLTGVHPHNLKSLVKKPMDEVLRFLRQEPLQRPSERLAAVIQERDRLSPREARRAIEVSRLRGELDWIALKAAAKDLEQRYKTVEALIRDLEAYRQNMPIQARPPSNLYLLRCYFKRHKYALTAASVMLLMLIAWSVHGRIMLERAERARQTAQEARAQTAKALLFVEDVLASSDPRKMGADARMVDVLDMVEERLGDNEENADWKGFIHNMLGRARFGLGENREAITHLAIAWNHRRRQLGPYHEDTLTSRRWLALILQRDPATLDEAIDHHREILRLRQEYHSGDGIAIGLSKSDLGSCLTLKRQFEDAEPLLLESLKTFEQLDRREDRAYTLTLSRVGGLYHRMRQLDKAESYYQQSLQLQRRMGMQGEPEYITNLSNLGLVLHYLGRLEEAEAPLRETLEWDQRRSDTHPYHIANLGNLGLNLLEQGRYPEADVYLNRAIDLSLQANNQKQYLLNAIVLGRSYTAQNQPECLASLLDNLPRLLELGQQYPGDQDDLDKMLRNAWDILPR